MKQGIHRPAERHDTVCRQLAHRGFQADESARGGGDANRSARVGAHRGEAHPVGHRRRGSTGRSARRAAWIQRMAGGPERRVLVGRAERELVQVGLADQHRAGLAQRRNRRRVAIGDVIPADARGGGGRRSAYVEQILDGDWHAVQRATIVAGGNPRFSSALFADVQRVAAATGVVIAPAVVLPS